MESQHPFLVEVWLWLVALIVSALTGAVALVVASLIQEADFSNVTLFALPDRIKVVAIMIGILAALPTIGLRLLCAYLAQTGPWLYIIGGILVAYIAHGYLGKTFLEIGQATGVAGSTLADATIGALVGLVFWATTVLLPLLPDEKASSRRSR